MPRKHTQKRRTGKRGQKSAFSSAPKQGISEHASFVMNDLQLPTIPSSSAPGLYTLRLSADANGWAWVISQNGVDVRTEPGNVFFVDITPYGYDNNQFSRLAQLWVEYRTDWIEIEVIPAAASGSFGCSAMVSVIDESGTLSGNTALGNLIPKLSSQRTTELHTPYQRIKRRFNFAKWIGQTQQTAWLQTQQADTSQVVRQFYNTPTVNAVTPGNPPVETSPALTVAMAANSLEQIEQIMATVRFRASYSFRQRKVLDDSAFPSDGIRRVVELYTSPDGRKCMKKTNIDQEDTSVASLTQSEFFRQPQMQQMMDTFKVTRQ